MDKDSTAVTETKGLQLDLDQVSRGKSIFNSDQVQKLFNSTPNKYLYNRPGKGGQTWTYAKIGYIRKVLDSVFGFNWDFEVETSLVDAFKVAQLTKVCVVKGVLSGRVMVDDNWVEIKKTQFGRSEVKFKRGTEQPLDFGNDMKAASTDALKKCASLLGIAADIYEKDDFMPINITGSKETKKTQVKDKIKEAKEVLNLKVQKVGGKDE